MQVGITYRQGEKEKVLNHFQSIHRGPPGCRAAWRARQQGDLRVRRVALADGAAVLPGSTGQVLSQHPPPPPSLNFKLHLKN